MAIGEASVRIVPDTSGFAVRVKKDVEDALNGVDKAVKDTTDEIGDNFDKAGKEAGKAAKGIGNEFKKLGDIIGGAALTKGVVNFAKGAINQASDLAESINAVQVSFGDLSDELFDFGRNAATAVGLSRAEFNSFAVRFSGFTKVIADESKSASDVTIELTKRIADFASVNNLALEEAALVFGSTLAGETEPIRRFGKDMSAAAVEAYALANGMIASKDEMTAAIKVQATYAKLMEDTNEVAGDFVNTADGFANRQRVLSANFKDMQAELGQALIPAMEGLLAVIDPIVTGISKIPAELRNLIAIVGLASAGMYGLTKSLVGIASTAGASSKAIAGLKASMGLLNVALIAFSVYQQQEANNAQTFAKTIKFLTTATDDQIDAVKSQIQTYIDFADISPEKAFRALAEESLGAAQRLVDAGQAQELFGISTSAATLIIGEQVQAQQQANEDAARAAKILEENAKAADSAAYELANYVKGLGFVVDESGRVEASQENIARAIELAQDRFDRAVEAVDNYRESIEEAFDAARSSIDTGFALVESQLEAVDALKEYEKAAKKSSTSAEELDKIARDTAKTMLTNADNAVANAEALAAIAGGAVSAAEKQEIYRQTLLDFMETINPSSPLYQYLNGIVQTLDSVPTDIPIELTTEVDAAARELSAFEELAGTMGFQIGNEITKGILSALAPLSPEFGKLLQQMGYLEGQAQRLRELSVLPTVKNPRSLADISPYLSFANGGIFDSPQVGLFAEAGAEAIIPLTRPARALELMRESGLLGLAQQSGALNQNFDIRVEAAEPIRTGADVVREFQALSYRMNLT